MGIRNGSDSRWLRSGDVDGGCFREGVGRTSWWVNWRNSPRVLCGNKGFRWQGDCAYRCGGIPMFPPKRILFPVDFSERSSDAARMVETFAGHFQAEVTLLHVLESLTYNDLPGNVGAVIQEQLNGYLTEELKHFDVSRV